METAKSLKNIAARQKELAAEIDAECKVLEESDLVKENINLKTEIEKLRADSQKISSDMASISEENSGLKNTLYEHVFNERNSIIGNAAQKLDIFFRAEKDGELNKLTAIERDVKARIKNIKEVLEHNNIDTKEEFNSKLDELSELLDRKVTEAREKAAQSDAFSKEEREQLKALKNKEITDEQIRAVAKKNNLERFIGLNVLNVIGIFLLFVGAVAAMRYTYYKLSDLFKGIMIFARRSVCRFLPASWKISRKEIYRRGALYKSVILFNRPCFCDIDNSHAVRPRMAFARLACGRRNTCRIWNFK